MKHLIICREYPPSPFPPGGIGTYVKHIARLLAECGDTVHVIAQRWEGAPAAITESHQQKLVVHRIAATDPVSPDFQNNRQNSAIVHGLTNGDCPSQAFSWQVAGLVEKLVMTEGIEVIEAPEWEAPLYYYQLRRSVGLGPSRQPPCIVHLHSPSELIFRHNQWDLSCSDYEPLRRLERYTVKAADALICPSLYLARQAEELFDLLPGQVTVIPYPLGDTAHIERSTDVWRRDTICFTGRLELRKGVVEWVNAAVKVAQTHPTVRFAFIGSDTSLGGGPGASVRGYLSERIPFTLRDRFQFHESMAREKLMATLAGVSMAVVPSRWENLPYSCIEAMSTGLPVLVSPHGGMPELIEQGESGWIAADTTPAALAEALCTALGTPPVRRAKLGQNAEAAVRRHCANSTVVERHREFRRLLLECPRTGEAVSLSSAGALRGTAVVVHCGNRPELLPHCLTAIGAQTTPPAEILVTGSPAALKTCRELGLSFIESAEPCAPDALPPVILDAASRVCGLAFVDASVQLSPNCLATIEAAFQRLPQAGLVSGFLSRGDKTIDAVPAHHGPLCPNDFCHFPFVAIRSAALSQPNAGWQAVTWPEILAASRPGAGEPAVRHYSAMALAQRTSPKLMWNWFLAAPLMDKARWMGRVFFRPRRAAQWLSWQLRTVSARTR
jgi:glycosyltransferase involved in cell wall biosynthesis